MHARKRTFPIMNRNVGTAVAISNRIKNKIFLFITSLSND